MSTVVESKARAWVLIETGSNQDFIFQSSRQRFQVGASALIKDVATWVEEAVKALGGLHQSQVDIVVCTSGKAVLLVDDPAVGREIVTAVTLRALDQAPGMDLWGYVEPTTLAGDPMVRLEALHGFHARARWGRPSPRVRAPLQPFMEACSLTGRPSASLMNFAPGAKTQVSPLARLAAERADTARASWSKEVRRVTLKDLSREVANAGWVAIVHADGNRIGEIIQRLVEVDTYRAFSEALADCTASAFDAAVAAVSQSVPDLKDWLLPLILGGDDTTFICDGRLAIRFTSAYLTAFEHASAASAPIRDAVAEAAANGATAAEAGHLTAAAGIALVKPHFPYHAAYDLAESLAHSVKERGFSSVGRSSYDFHVLHDSVARPLSDLRDALVTTHLTDDTAHTVSAWAGPFLAPSGVGAAENVRDDAHLFAAAQVLGGDRDERLLSGSAIHDLRVAAVESRSAFEVARRRIRGTLQPANRPKFDRFIEAQIDQKAVDPATHPVTFGRILATIDLVDIEAGRAQGVRPAASAKAGRP
ncbi:MAG: hypothetical protein WAV45_05885 [Propionibacteriaceae bacterium]|nr:hypothetical protein [Micropruina sp.]HBX81085.1 hypothetical protein [Propionibacteriaceae bacterium]HBY22663.1 hypothetical protein [Propionibacteriaceae bacterium]